MARANTWTRCEHAQLPGARRISASPAELNVMHVRPGFLLCGDMFLLLRPQGPGPGQTSTTTTVGWRCARQTDSIPRDRKHRRQEKEALCIDERWRPAEAHGTARQAGYAGNLGRGADGSGSEISVLRFLGCIPHPFSVGHGRDGYAGACPSSGHFSVSCHASPL